MKKSPAPTTSTAARTRRLLTVALIIAVALGASACQPVYSGPQGPRVAVVGDSITNSASDELDDALTEKHRHLSGIDGIDLAEGRTRLIRPVTDTDPSVLVIELGINSAREVWNSADLTHLEAMLADVKTVPCVIWVTPTALESSYFDHLGEGMISARIAMFQASLKKRLPKHPNVHLADFGAIEVQHPEWFHADRLHLNAEGQTAYATYIADQIATHCPTGATP